MDAIEASGTTITAREGDPGRSPKLLLRVEEAAEQLGIVRSLMYRPGVVWRGRIRSVGSAPSDPGRVPGRTRPAAARRSTVKSGAVT